MRSGFACLCHLAVLLTAWRTCHSTSGFLLNGPAVCLLLDRWFLGLLPWSVPVRRRWEWFVAGTVFLLGTAGFYLARRGIVPWWEATYRGAMVAVAVLVIETLAAAASPSRPFGRWCLRRALGGLLLLVPVAAGLHPLHTVPKRAPAALGLMHEDVRFRTADGVVLAAWLVPHPSARGNVVFCHGHGRNRGHVAGVLPTLHALGLNVLAFDFRGHGDSQGHTSTFGFREVRDVVAGVNFLRERFPGKPLFLVGVSLGTASALQSLPHLEDVSGVWSEGAFSRLDSVVDNEFSLLPGVVRKPLVGLYHELGWLDCGLRVSSTNPVEAIREQRVRIHFCHGRLDELVPPAEGEALYAACIGPKWLWRADATHYNVRQRNRGEYLARLRRFVEGGLR